MKQRKSKQVRLLSGILIGIVMIAVLSESLLSIPKGHHIYRK